MQASDFKPFRLPEPIATVECICTGMWVTTGLESWRGDLFRLGDTLIVNQNPADGPTMSELDPSERVLHVGIIDWMHTSYFSRPHCTVIKIDKAAASDSLIQYIKGEPL